MTRVKLCGMWRDEDLLAVRAARPDLVGFVVEFPRSHRSVSGERLVELCRALGETDIERVGVFVDASPARVAELAAAAGLAWVQLHGHEDEGYIGELRVLLASSTPAGAAPARVIQAFRVRSAEDVARAAASSADLVLLDNGQGTGEAFDWGLVRHVVRPFVLAGGLAPDNVGRAIDAVRPWGVDMSSGIETDRVKDPDKMRAAVAAVRAADRKD